MDQMITFIMKNSHVIPALIRRFHNAIQLDKNEVVIWGSGEPKESFCMLMIWQAPVYLL